MAIAIWFVSLSLLPAIPLGRVSAAPTTVEAYQAVVVPPLLGQNICVKNVDRWQDTPRYQEPVTGATVAFKHDRENLYFYAEWSVASPSPNDYFGVEFDNNGDGAHMGSRSSPDDAFFVSPSFYAGGSRCARDAFMSGFAFPTLDLDVGGTNDTVGRMVYTNGTYYIEVMKPFITNDAAGHDIAIDESTTIGVGFAAGVFGAGAGHRATDMSSYRLVLTNKSSTSVGEVTIVNPVDTAYNYGILLVLATLALVAFHFVRRRAWRATIAVGEATPKGGAAFVAVKHHDLSTRAIHWTHVALMVSLLATGFGIHWRVYLLGPVTSLVHVMIGVAILVVDFPLRFVSLYKTKDFAYLARPRKEDFKEMAGITANFFGLSKKYPEHVTVDPATNTYFENRKYCSLQKAMLWGDLAAILAMAITGFALYPSSALGWVVDILGGSANVRALHLLTFFYFAATLVGHFYLSVIPHNWGKMRAMVRGTGRVQAHVPTAEGDGSASAPLPAEEA